jgi:AraC family transcriptional regulator, dual regulator of chb operon
MENIKLKENDVIDPDIGSSYGIINALEDANGMHSHDFFELFLVTEGNVFHLVNGKIELLMVGSLVFIRPDDIHFYEKCNNDAFQIINIAFPANTIYALFDYLGKEFLPERLVKSEFPLVVILSKSEKDVLKSRLDALFTMPLSIKTSINIELRVLLVEFLAHYFPLESRKKKASVPEWLDCLCIEMQKKEHLREGLPAMHRLTHMSPEYLCRTFKKYLDKTPLRFMNELRLNYAANLLTCSDESIISISMEAGFDNLSHFYHCFKKFFNFTPAKFRSINQKTMI